MINGKEEVNHDGKYLFYRCNCGKITNYGTYRHKDSKEYCINSCCGGCDSATNIKFCCFCGVKIE